jgi:kynurenine formamidase
VAVHFLSYPIEKIMPVYGTANANIEIVPVKSICNGDSCNAFKVSIENHIGTHVDCPSHFFGHGLKISDYPADTWFFSKPHVIRLPLNENQIVTPGDLGGIPEGVDLLLIQSDFSRFRGTDIYSRYNPGFHPKVGEWLREKYPHVRAVGFDFISLSAYQNRDMGREAHRKFLDPEGSNAPVLIIEDMDLSLDLRGLKQVLAFPLRIEGIDSAPCTVIGVFE